MVKNEQLKNINVESFKSYFEEILVIKAEDSKFYWLNLYDEVALTEIDLKGNNLKNCDWNQQGLKCVDDSQVSFVEFKYKNGSLVLKEIERFFNSYDKKALFINSEIDFNLTISLFQNPLTETFTLKGWKEHSLFEVENISGVSHESQLEEISFRNYVFITKSGDEYQLKVLKDRSEVVVAGPEKIKNFKKFINFPNASLFAIQYENKGHKLLVLDANFSRNRRGVELINLDCAETPKVSLSNYSDSQFVVYSYCKSKKALTAFMVQKQGPLALLVRAESIEISQAKGDQVHPIHFKVTNVDLQDSCKVISQEI